MSARLLHGFWILDKEKRSSRLLHGFRILDQEKMLATMLHGFPILDKEERSARIARLSETGQGENLHCPQFLEDQLF